MASTQDMDVNEENDAKPFFPRFPVRTNNAMQCSDCTPIWQASERGHVQEEVGGNCKTISLRATKPYIAVSSPKHKATQGDKVAGVLQMKREHIYRLVVDDGSRTLMANGRFNRARALNRQNVSIEITLGMDTFICKHTYGKNAERTNKRQLGLISKVSLTIIAGSCHGHRRGRSVGRDVDGGVLGGEADGAGVQAWLARLAQAQVPARQQQHRRLPLTARSARPIRGRRGRGGSSCVRLPILRHNAAGRLRVVRRRGLAEPLDDGRRRAAEQHEVVVERGAELRGDGLVAAREAAPRPGLGGRPPQPLLELRVPAARGVQLRLLLPQPACRGAQNGARQLLPLPLQLGAQALAFGPHQRRRRPCVCPPAGGRRRQVHYPARLQHRRDRQQRRRRR
jgi:hypothetical protein